MALAVRGDRRAKPARASVFCHLEASSVMLRVERAIAS